MKFKWKLPVNFPFQKKHWLFLGYFLFLYCCDSGVPSYPTALLSVLVSHGFHNILLQAKWLKITQIYYFVVLEFRSPAWISLGWNHSVESAIFLLEDLWKNLFFLPFPRSRGHLYSWVQAPFYLQSQQWPVESFSFGITLTLAFLPTYSIF